jgi:hypothetical protein
MKETLLGILLSIASLFGASEINLGGTFCYPVDGCTGTDSVPTKGQVLVGQTDGTYEPQATSTLGLGGVGGSSEWNDAGSYLYPKEGDYISGPRIVATSTSAASTFAYRVGIGTTTPNNLLSVTGTTSANIFTSNGANDLILKTGNATTGSITITDGTNGAIDLNANGTGEINLNNNNGTFTLDTNGAVNFDSTIGVSSTIKPSADNSYDLGDSSLGWANIYFATDGFINWRGSTNAITETVANDGIRVGTASAAGHVSSRGNHDLVLETGNTTTGNITITDGANGNFSLTPNGTGAVNISTRLAVTGMATSSSLTVTGLTSALTLTGANGTFAEYAGTSCAGQVVRSLSALGVATCGGSLLSTTTAIASNQIVYGSGASSLASEAAFLYNPTSNVFSADTVIANTGFFPDVNDGAGLGSSTRQFADLYLATGGTIDWNNGDVNLTHAANTMNFTGASSGWLFGNFIGPVVDDGSALGSATNNKWSDLFLAEGAIINFDNGDLTFTQTGNEIVVNGGELIANDNVGIGTTTAGAELDVWGDSGQSVVKLFSDTGTKFMDMLNTGVTTLLGTWDFTSAVIRISNGTGPTADDPGELAHDTTGNQIIIDDYVIPAQDQKIWSVTVASTSPTFIQSGLLAIPTLLDGYTITRIQCHVSGGTSKIIAVEDASANSSEDITCATTNTTDDGSITNATYTASELSFIDFGATSGSVNTVSISVFGNWTRE